MDINAIICKLENGVETQLGGMFKDSTQISQGEWQKVAIARALYRKGTILILDEPSSALDPETERKIFRVVKNLMYRNNIRFTFIITHNYNNLIYSNKVLWLEYGGVKYFGNSNDFEEVRSELVEEGEKLEKH